jgi:cytosine deaminase
VLIDCIVGATTLEDPTPHDLVFVDGHVARGAMDDPTRGEGTTLDAAGRVVVPGFVDAHVHLDKAYLLAEVERRGPVGPHLDDAIAAVARLRGVLPLSAVGAAARRALATMIGHGTVAARVHVELEPATGRELVALHHELAEEAAERCRLQLVAFPQLGLATQASRRLLADAMGAGLHVVGGCPYVDDDPVAHLDEVFALAERHGAPVDLHLDFSDDPSRSLLAAVVERTVAHGMQGRVTVGHCTTLAALAPDAQRAVLDDLAAASIGLVVLPFSDLHLTGHGEPGTRSIAPVARAAAAGVAVAVATNNLANPFAPSGNGSVLQAAWLAGVVQRAVGAVDDRLLLDAITTTPARLLDLDPHGTRPGEAADLVVLDATDPTAVVSQAPAALATLRAGRLVHRLAAPRALTATAATP